MTPCQTRLPRNVDDCGSASLCIHLWLYNMTHLPSCMQESTYIITTETSRARLSVCRCKVTCGNELQWKQTRAADEVASRQLSRNETSNERGPIMTSAPRKRYEWWYAGTLRYLKQKNVTQHPGSLWYGTHGCISDGTSVMESSGKVLVHVRFGDIYILIKICDTEILIPASQSVRLGCMMISWLSSY